MAKQKYSSTTPPEEHSQETDKPIGYFELIRRNLNFRYLWGGQVVSILGDWFNSIAAAILVAELTGSALAVGFLFSIQLLSPFVVAPLAGICADRYNRKHILIITDVIRAFVVLGFLFVQDETDIWLLYTLTALLFGVSGFFSPVQSAILPDITSGKELGTANALSSVTWAVMLALGAMTGGLTAGLFGIHTAFVIDALSFLMSAGFLLRVRLPRSQSASRGTSRDAKFTALRYMLKHPDILFIATHKAAMALLMSSGSRVVQVAIAQNYFVIGIGGAISLGLMRCMNGIGSAIGPILARRWVGDQDKPARMAISFGYLIAATGVSLIAPLFNLETVLLGGFLRNVGGSTAWVFSSQLLLQNAPNEIRGRIFGTEYALYTLMGSIGTATFGLILDRSEDIHTILWVMAVLPLIPAVLWWLWQRHPWHTSQSKPALKGKQN